MDLRYATAKDAETVSRIVTLSWKHAYRGIIPQPYLDSLDAQRDISLYISWFLAEGSFVQLALCDGEPVACVSYGPARDRTYSGWGEIAALYVLPDFMGRGAGRLLLQSAVRDLSKRGFARLYLWVLEQNLRARHFYELSGWSSSGEGALITILGKDIRQLRYTLSYEPLSHEMILQKNLKSM